MALTRIAIVGGGIGGLTLARILQLRKVPSLLTLYESDANASLRASFGGSLDLKRETGQRAMHDAGLHAEFLKLCRPAGGQLTIVDSKGKIFHEDKGSVDDLYNPEIDRGQLRSLILDSLDPNTVQWGHKASAVYRDAATGKFTLEFASGKTRDDIDIVVGADGAWSTVRQLVSPGISPKYSGVTFVETKVDMKAHPELSPLVGEGSMIAMGEGKCIMAQRSSNDVLTVYSALRVSEDWARTSNVAQAKTAEKIKLMLDEFAGWDESLRQYIRVGEDPTMRPIYVLPHDAEPRAKAENVVLLGDAAHLMSPFAGAGVNLAMTDAADLADTLATGAPLETYEATMLARANAAGKESAQNLEMFFDDDAVGKLSAFFKSHAQA